MNYIIISGIITNTETVVTQMQKIRVLALLVLLYSFAPNYPSSAQNSGKDTLSEIRAELNRSKDFNAALERLQALLAKEPGNAEAHMLCGKVLQRMGYEGLADEEYKSADKLDPTQPESVLALFHSKLETEGLKAANEYLHYVELRFPYDPSVLIMKGLLARMHGQDEKAEFLYKLAMERNPGAPGIATAFASLRISQKRYDEAIELAEKDLKLHKDHPVASLAVGQALFLKGQSALAIPYLQTALKTGLEKRETADLLARAFINNGEPGEALEPTLISLAWTPNKERKDIDRLKKRLYFIMQNRNASEIINSLQVVSRDLHALDMIASVYFASGDVLDFTGHPEEAQEAFGLGVRYLPAGRAFMRLGILAERKRDYATALNYYAKAHEIDPEDRETAARLARLLNRSKVQSSDVAWEIRDALKGGRLSIIPGS